MFDRRTIEDLEIVDESSFRSIALCAGLKRVVGLPVSRAPRAVRGAERSLLLNLTSWSADAGGDKWVDR